VKGLRYRLVKIKAILHPVTNIEKLKYLQNHEMKSKKADKIQDRRVAMLKRVGHMYIKRILSLP
jgi:hypothetical protein